MDSKLPEAASTGCGIWDKCLNPSESQALSPAKCRNKNTFLTEKEENFLRTAKKQKSPEEMCLIQQKRHKETFMDAVTCGFWTKGSQSKLKSNK